MTDVPPPFDSPLFLFFLGAIIGAALGSFATMLAYRLPRHLSIITPRSHCPSCNQVLGVRDLVPILSWIFAGGKCRYCHAGIGTRYLWIEVTTSLAYAVATAAIGITLALPIAYAVIIALVTFAAMKAQA